MSEFESLLIITRISYTRFKMTVKILIYFLKITSDVPLVCSTSSTFEVQSMGSPTDSILCFDDQNLETNEFEID